MTKAKYTNRQAMNDNSLTYSYFIQSINSIESMTTYTEW